MALTSQLVASQSMPPGCQAKVVAYTTPLSGQTEDVLDLRQLVLTGYINAIQSLYIDNSLNGQNIVVRSLSVGQNIVCPANCQGYFPILVVPGAEQFGIASTGSVDVPLFFGNVPMPANVWHV
jgi:hypothetical protein